MMFRVIAVAFVANLAACADLPDVANEGCGNLVLNEDEDCDGFGQTPEDSTACGAPGDTNACFFVCDGASGAVCPQGWGCGSDGRCRRASARFAPGPGSPWRFRVGDFEVGDMDGDGNADLVGNDVQELKFRYGSATGDFSSEVELVTRQPFGPLSYGLFDNDELLDVVVPTEGGLFVLLGDASRVPEPVAYSPFEVPLGPGGARLQPIESDGGRNLNTELLAVFGTEMQFIGSNAPIVNLPAGGQLTSLAGAIAVADLDFDADGRSEFALAFQGDSSVWLYTSVGVPAAGNLSPALYQEVRLPLGARVKFGCYLADINGDGSVDLMVSMVTPTGNDKVAVAINDGNGVLGPAVARPVYDRGMAGDSVWPIAVGNFAGDEKADYVFPDFIAVSDLGIPNPGAIPVALVPTQFVANEDWTEAVIGEFNGDGLGDVATAIEGRDGIDVFLNAANSGIFNKFQIDTDDPPRNLRVDDFDGDFISDIAFVESGFGVKPDAVTVIFGDTAGGPSDPVAMGSLGFVIVMEPLSSVSSTEGIDAIGDLFVLSSSFPDREVSAVAVLQGSSSRRMLSPFTLQPPDMGMTAPEPDLPTRAIFGKFTANGDEFNDIVAVSESVPDFDVEPLGSGFGTSWHLWLLPGSGPDGELSAGTADFVTLPDAETFNTACAVWTAGDIDGDGRDEIVGIDNSTGCQGFGGSPASRLAIATVSASGSTVIDTTIRTLDIGGRAVSKVALVDVDGDGDKDLIAMFKGEIFVSAAEDTPIDGAAVAVLWNINGALAMSGITELTFSGGQQLFDVEVIRLDASGVPSLAILATDGVYSSKLDIDTKQYTAPTKLLPQFGDGKLEVGDMNGDGLDDIAFTVGDEVRVLLALSDDPLGSAVQTPVAEGENQ